jgi:hypothetical protein
MARTMVTLTCAAILAATSFTIAQDTSTSDAASMKRKLEAIAARGARPPAKTTKPAASGALTTSFTDRETNAYFKVNGREFLPPGLENPQVTIEDGGRVRSRATVDLDVVLKTRERSMFDPLSWLTGKTEVTAVGLVRGANSKGTLQLESATLGGVPVPKTLLQQIVSFYTRTPEHPAGFDIDKPFDLPSNIRSIETRRGQATIVQP